MRFRNLDVLRSKLVRNTLWMVSSKLLNIFIQAGLFIIVARELGPSDYGAFVGIAAFIGIFFPFAGVGSAKLLIRNAARNPSVFRDYFGKSIFITITSGALLIALALILYAIIFSSRFWLACVLIAIADLLFFRLYRLAIAALTSAEMMQWVAKVDVLFRLTGLLAAFCLGVFFDNPGVIVWATLYLCSRVITVLWSFLLVFKLLGTPKFVIEKLQVELFEGISFAVGESSATIYSDVDKTMLARLSTLDAAGIYGAAYKIVNVAFTPILSLIGSAQARFFKSGEVGISNTLQFVKKLVPIAALYGFLASSALMVIAPVVPNILGEEYQSSVNALRWLSPLIFLKCLHYFAADTLTGAGFQGLRTLVQIGIAFFNFVANLWLIPLYSWKGAAWSSLASDGLLVIVLWALVFHYQNKQSIREENQ